MKNSNTNVNNDENTTNNNPVVDGTLNDSNDIATIVDKLFGDRGNFLIKIHLNAIYNAWQNHKQDVNYNNANQLRSDVNEKHMYLKIKADIIEGMNDMIVSVDIGYNSSNKIIFSGSLSMLTQVFKCDIPFASCCTDSDSNQEHVNNIAEKFKDIDLSGQDNNQDDSHG